MSPNREHVVCTLGVALSTLVGCTRISVEPFCPRELGVGESGPVVANETDPGAIAIYLWEVFPADAGTFTNPSAANTTFQALAEGEAIIRLTARDGLYQAIAECRTVVTASAGGDVGNDNAPGDQNVNGNDNANDDANDNGGDDGNENLNPGDFQNDNVDDNLNENALGNDNVAGNANDNSVDNTNDNVAENANDNSADNTNDNREDVPNDNAGGRPPRPGGRP